jgi:hypothetical protein
MPRQPLGADRMIGGPQQLGRHGVLHDRADLVAHEIRRGPVRRLVQQQILEGIEEADAAALVPLRLGGASSQKKRARAKSDGGVQGSITASPAAVNALVSWVATCKIVCGGDRGDVSCYDAARLGAEAKKARCAGTRSTACNRARARDDAAASWGQGGMEPRQAGSLRWL